MSVQPTLVVLAAGLGSRYGGVKQMEPVGPSGEFLLEYSIYDAIRAGFSRVVFVVNRKIAGDFRDVIGKRVARTTQVEYVLQELTSALPGGMTPPRERVKPWGTGHAVLVCKDVVKSPFGVINADDFYGRGSYEVLAAFLRDNRNVSKHVLVGFPLGMTMSEYGSVSRGLCEMDDGGELTGIFEQTHVERVGIEIRANGPGGNTVVLTGDETVSMNMWGFSASAFALLEGGFADFLRKHNGDPKAEFYLPAAIDSAVKTGMAGVKVLRTAEKWFGMTHKDDRAAVSAEIRKLVDYGVYPVRLWA